MTALRVMAWVVVGLSALKLVAVLISPKAWLENVVRPVYSHGISQWIFIILALCGMYFLKSALTGVEFLAAIFVIMFLFAAGLVPYAKHLMPAFESIYKDKKNLWKKVWPLTLVWIVILGWAIAMW